MIKCNKGGTQIKGSMIDTIQDFVNIIRAVKITLEEDLSEETAAEIIQMCGRLAYSEDEISQTNLIEDIEKVIIENKA